MASELPWRDGRGEGCLVVYLAGEGGSLSVSAFLRRDLVQHPLSFILELLATTLRRLHDALSFFFSFFFVPFCFRYFFLAITKCCSKHDITWGYLNV